MTLLLPSPADPALAIPRPTGGTTAPPALGFRRSSTIMASALDPTQEPVAP